MKRMRLTLILLIVLVIGACAQDPDQYFPGITRMDSAQFREQTSVPTSPASGFFLNVNGYPLWWDGVAWDTLGISPTGIVTDHGILFGLTDDDHDQVYYNTARLVAWLATKALTDLGTVDHGSLTGRTDDDHNPIYYTLSRLNTWLLTRSLTDLGTTSHGSLSERTFDDHNPVYYTTSRLNTWFTTKDMADLNVANHGDLSGTGGDDHTQYQTEGRANTWFTTKSIASLGTKSHTDLTDKGTSTHSAIDDSIQIFSDSIIMLMDSTQVFSDSIKNLSDSVVDFSAAIIVLEDSAQVFSDSIANISGDVVTHLADETNPHSVDETDILPSQTGNNGKYLTTDGSAASWAAVAGGASGDSVVTTTDSIKEWNANAGIWLDGFHLENDTVDAGTWEANPIADAYIPNNITITLATTNASDISTAETDIINLQDSMVTVYADVATAETDIINLQDSMVTVYADVATAETDIINLQDSMITAYSDIDALETITDSTRVSMDIGAIDEYTNGAGVTIEGVLIKDGNIASSYVVADSVNQLWEQIFQDTTPIKAVAHMLLDTVCYPFMIGLGNTGDSASFQVGSYAGGWKQRQDSLLPRILNAELKGESGDSITFAIYADSTGFDDGSSYAVLTTTGIGVDGGAIEITSFALNAMGKDNWIWMEIVALVGTRPKFFIADFGYSEKRAP